MSATGHSECHSTVPHLSVISSLSLLHIRKALLLKITSRNTTKYKVWQQLLSGNFLFAFFAWFIVINSQIVFWLPNWYISRFHASNFFKKIHFDIFNTFLNTKSGKFDGKSYRLLNVLGIRWFIDCLLMIASSSIKHLWYAYVQKCRNLLSINQSTLRGSFTVCSKYQML